MSLLPHIVLAAALSLTACSQTSNATTQPDSPAQVVRAVFDAAAAFDCKRLSSRLVTAVARVQREQGCIKLMQLLRDRPLVETLGTLRDGRRPQDLLLRIRVAEVDSKVVVRLRRQGRQWKVVSL